MTLVAPRSRQGKSMLVLAILAAVLAVGGAFLWASQAHADLPTTTITLAQSPATPGPAIAGSTVTYTMTTSTSGANSSGAVVMTMTVDTAHLANEAVTCPAANAGGAGITWAGVYTNGTGVATCTSSAILTAALANAVMTVAGEVTGAVGAPSAAGAHDGAGPTVAAVSNSTVGALGFTAGATVSDSTNPAGVPHTFVFNLLAGWTCGGDSTINDLVDCVAGDVTLAGTTTCTAAAPVVGSPSTADASTVTVTITPSAATTGTCTVALAIKFVGPVEDSGGDDCCATTVTATKTYAPLTGVIRHVDVDCATERAANAGNNHTAGAGDYGSNTLACNGLLSNGNIFAGKNAVTGYALDDPDDAVGSLHSACILSGLLTSADNANIHWDITPTALHQQPSDVNLNGKTGIDVSGNSNLEPCVQWRVGDVGVEQIISAVWIPTGQTIFSNGVQSTALAPDPTHNLCPSAASPATAVWAPCQSLIKQWNSIDSTKIVQVTGDVGPNMTIIGAGAITGLTATGGTTSTIDDSDATFGVNAYVGRTVTFTAGTGSGQTAVILSNTATQITFVDTVTTAATATTVYTIGAASGQNTGELANFSASGRDGNDCSASGGDFCARLNLDGSTVTSTGAFFNLDGTLLATGRSFIDYALGSHANYNGPVDGVQQTYTLSGDCGTAKIEDPTTGVSHLLDLDSSATNPSSITLTTNSDKGVGFTITPSSDGDITVSDSNLGDADCVDGESTTITITSVESASFNSTDPDTAPTETITMNWVAGPVPEKQPMLAWVGQRIVLEHDWSAINADGSRSCPWVGNESDPSDFFVRYLIQEPSPGALSNIPELGPAEVLGPDFIIVRVTPDDECISHVIYESQNQGRVDVTAHVVSPPDRSTQGPFDPGSDWSVISQEYDFWYFYMKIESTTIALVPGTRSGHNDGPFTPENPDPADDVATMTGADAVNVSQDVLARVTVKGWVLADNCPQKAESKDVNGLLLPANRCTFPDDWVQVIGHDAQFDILGDSPNCSNVAGPFSLLEEIVSCGDSDAPHVDGGFRESVFPDGTVNAWDAPMPPALVAFTLDGAGFLHGADKADIYSDDNQYFDTHIPAEPWIIPASPYLWHTWTGTGARSGLYHFWTSLAGSGNAIVSCPGASSAGCAGGVATGGFDMIQVYSDNHGEAMAWINGDANLDFSLCDNSADPSVQITFIHGFYCKTGTVVGHTEVSADADYPDKKPHQDVPACGPFGPDVCTVNIDWTWGGIKNITVEDDPADASGQYHYVVFHVTDRDGFCGDSPSLHPVLGEEVDFRIDSTTGVILPNVNGDSAEGPAFTFNDKAATTHTFDTAANESVTDGGITVEPVQGPDGFECQAWIHVSESLLNQVDVIVTAHDPEGTVTFDTKDINPTPVPTPTPEPTAAPTPVTFALVWGDTDCGGTVAPRDGQAILKRILELPELSVNQPCPGMGQEVIIDGVHYHWADWDCSGAIAPRDGQAVLKNVLAQTALSQSDPCPEVGSNVQVEVVSLP